MPPGETTSDCSFCGKRQSKLVLVTANDYSMCPECIESPNERRASAIECSVCRKYSYSTRKAIRPPANEICEECVDLLFQRRGAIEGAKTVCCFCKSSQHVEK